MNNDKIKRFENADETFRCPICRSYLKLKEKSLKCENNHSFDIAKQGYINLLMNSKKQKLYDKSSFENRRLILENGFYDHILKEILLFLNNNSINKVLDIGCGEGFYSNKISQLSSRALEIFAFDIAKDSIVLATKEDSDRSVKWFVSDLADLPIQNSSIDCILDIFSPANYNEFNRILKDDGFLLKIVPGENHLKEIRARVKDKLNKEDYSNKDVINCFEESFKIIDHKKVSASYKLSTEERHALIHMTPLLFNIDMEKIDWNDMSSITIDAEMLIGKKLVP
ncbi:MAG: methyltransferase domain-containing protein [Peptostreptococcus sp.]|uniref:putative RNA methyltransferase n=1 Tax=Peptostreptococcus sp. TaxID=1262 RepID=UPI002FCA7A37